MPRLSRKSAPAVKDNSEKDAKKVVTRKANKTATRKSTRVQQNTSINKEPDEAPSLVGNEKENVDVAAPSTPKKQGIRIGPQTASATKPPSGTTLNLDENDLDNKENQGIQISFNPTSLFSIDPKVKKVYKIIQKTTGALGGNGYDGAIYGELTMHSMQKVINYMVDNCEMTSSSRFIDVGSGLGKPNFHVTQDPAVRLSIGIELEEIRWQLGMQNLKSAIAEMHECIDASNDDGKLNHGVNFLHGDIFDVATTDPFTHVYMYDLGFPPPLQQKIAEYFNASTHAQYLVSYRPPRRVIKEYGYQVTEIGKINTSMTGSGENHTAYFYKRASRPAPCRARPNTSIVCIPARAGSDEQPIDVVCSDKFKECVTLAVGPLEECAQYVRTVADTMINAERPKRERRQRVLDA
mmetsp:Transcript_24351/g.35723  ORF Transcript_24351/g.35723 Transcript_24351/m.35723 type:complete len:408 (+) Transcript_24351:29-1252(+)